MPLPGVDQVRITLNIVLGRKTMTVAEYLRLERGSMVALDPMPDDMVEILAGGKLIGRGVVNVRGDRISVELRERVRGS
jgi:flagellar motor switch protein FliN/FliY